MSKKTIKAWATIPKYRGFDLRDLHEFKMNAEMYLQGRTPGDYVIHPVTITIHTPKPAKGAPDAK